MYVVIVYIPLLFWKYVNFLELPSIWYVIILAIYLNNKWFYLTLRVDVFCLLLYMHLMLVFFDNFFLIDIFFMIINNSIL